MSGRYDPRSAVKALIDTAQRQQPVIKSANIPGLVKENGESFSPVPRPSEGLCVLVAAIERDPSALPRDFVDVPLTRDGLKEHVRPDGGVCLGFFSNGPEDAVVLYGDPSIDREQAVHLVTQFWAQLAERRAPKIKVVS